MSVADSFGSTSYDWKMEAVDVVLDRVRKECERAYKKHPPLHSPHEGHSVIREELDELWDHVKADTGQSPDAMVEAVQVAAMGVRYVVDLTRDDKA